MPCPVQNCCVCYEVEERFIQQTLLDFVKPFRVGERWKYHHIDAVAIFPTSPRQGTVYIVYHIVEGRDETRTVP